MCNYDRDSPQRSLSWFSKAFYFTTIHDWTSGMESKGIERKVRQLNE
jgi:hypothetical protein